MEIELSESQRAAVAQMKQADWKGIVWHKPGEGKTRIALSCVIQSCSIKMFIVAPKRAINSWKDEIENCGVTIPFEIHSADSLHKISMYALQAGTFLIVDELYMFGNASAERSEHLRRISLWFGFRIGLSGTIMPADNNETIWGQLSVLHLERYLAENITSFRSLYRESLITLVKAFPGKVELKTRTFLNQKGSKEKILKQISSFIHVHFPDNSHRNITKQVLNLNLTNAQHQAILQLKRFYRLEIETGNFILDFNYATQVMFAICKITNGWIKNSEGTTVYYRSNKMVELENILETLSNANEKAVIWCAFRGDVEFLEKHLPYPTLRFMGGEAFNQKAWESGKYPFVLATIASGSSVNYFGNVGYGIYYSLPFKTTELLQSEGRHERKSSTHSGAFYYYLVCKEPSFDSRIYKLLTENQEIEKEFILHAIAKFLDLNQNS